MVEKATRNCYQSERKNDDETPEQWCRRILLRSQERLANHGAMLEQGTVYLTVPGDDDYIRTKYTFNDYSVINDNYETGYQYITTNLRVIIERHWEDDLKYACAPTKYHEKRYTAHFITNRAMLAELTRHRVFSFAVESTRYCNYAQGRFGKELTFIEPCWEMNPEPGMDGPTFTALLREIEYRYMQFVDIYHWKPQQAATILPNALKVSMYMTGFVKDWADLFQLRSEIGISGPPHPQMIELIEPLRREFSAKRILSV